MEYFAVIKKNKGGGREGKENDCKNILNEKPSHRIICMI